MLRLSIILSFVILVFGLNAGFAQDVMFDDMPEHDGAIYLQSVSGSEIPFNADGFPVIAHPAFRMDVEERVATGLAVSIASSGDISGKRTNDPGPTFNLTYLDVVNGTGAGFDHPTDGEKRRSALEAAFQYYASVIQDEGDADIEIRESFSASPNSNPFAFSAAYYFGSKGFNSPFTQHHIISGNDPYNGFPDGYIQFNFHNGFNYNYAATASPSDDQFDFYTIALHEILHLLGFTSYSNQNGGSDASEHVYTSFDENLADYQKDQLFESSGSGSGTTINIPVASLLTNNQVWFELYSSQFAPVFSPDPFNGSSLDHFDNGRSDHGEYLMHPSLSKGIAFKLLHEDEAQVLEKLDFSVNYSVTTSIADQDVGVPNSVLSSLYPNPAYSTEGVQIDIDQINEPQILVVVYDMLGRESYSKVVLNEVKGPITAIDPYNNLAPGMYIVIGSTKDELFNEKLVIK